MFALLQAPEHAGAKKPAGITLLFATQAPFSLKSYPGNTPVLKILLHNTCQACVGNFCLPPNCNQAPLYMREK